MSCLAVELLLIASTSPDVFQLVRAGDHVLRPCHAALPSKRLPPAVPPGLAGSGAGQRSGTRPLPSGLRGQAAQLLPQAGEQGIRAGTREAQVSLARLGSEFVAALQQIHTFDFFFEVIRMMHVF